MKRVSVKRFLAMVLAVAVLVAMNASPAAVWAAQLQKPEMPSASITKINPMYAHLEVPASTGVSTASTDTVYEAVSFQEAAAILKDLLYDRTEEAVLQMPVDITYDAANEEAFWEALWKLEEELFLAAVAHTGDPLEGDYLRYNIYMRDIEASMWVEDTTMVELYYYFTYHATAEQEKAADAAVDTLLDSWDWENADDYEKVCMAYDWLCDNVVYTEDLSPEYGTIYSAYGALVEKDCVCQGYASALYRLLLEMGVDCRVIAGIGNGGPHAWNIIEMDGLYYDADATWDASCSQAGWEYQYFLKSEANFPDHYRETEFTTSAFHAAYPMGEEDYVYVPSTEEPATSGTCGENLTWVLDENGLLTISGEGEMTACPWKEEYAASITSVVIEAGATSICGNAFSSCTNLTSVSVPSTVTDMGGYTFECCSSLKTVNIPQGVTTLKEGIFKECESLTSVVIPESVTKIGKLAFHYAELESVVIPANVTEICEAAFYGCKALDEIVFTGDVPVFGDYVFRYVSAIAYYPYGNATWTEDVLQDYDGTLIWVYQDEDGAIHGDNGDGTAWVLSGDTLTLSGTGEMIRSTWSHFRNQIHHVVIQEGITSIGVIVFGNMFNLETVDIPASVTRIREDAFSMDDCLQTVTIRGNGLETIESWAFYGCSALESLTLPDSVTEICPEAFAECTSLQTITFQGNAPTIGENAFSGVTATIFYPAGTTWTEEVLQQYGGTLTWVADGPEAPATSGTCGETATWSFADGVLTISGTGAVTENPWLETYADSITAAVIEDGITYLCDNAFNGCEKLAAVSIANTVETIGYYAFQNCTALQSVVIPGSVQSIGHSAFRGCTALTQVTLEEGVAFIQLYAFSGSGLTSVVIPASVTNLGVEAFGDCAALKNVEFLGAAPEFDLDVFKNVEATVRYPADDSWTDEVKQQYGGTLTWVTEHFALEGVSVTLGDSLDILFVVDADHVDEGCYAVCTRSYADGREDHLVTVPYDRWTILYGNLLAISYTGIAAKEMGDAVTVVIYDANGNAISEPWTDSIKTYAMRMLQDTIVTTDAELMTVFVDMLNYGAAAQAFFGYDTEHPVNAELTQEQQDYATDSYTAENNLVSGPGRAATSLTLKNRITLDIFFKNSVIGSDYSSLYAVVTYTDHYGRPVQLRIEGADFKVYDAQCGYVSVPGLAIADYGQAVNCTVYDAQDNALAWATDSIEGYAHRMAEQLPEIVDAIMKFGVSAYNFFHS